jgi:hypothetical protein
MAIQPQIKLHSVIKFGICFLKDINLGDVFPQFISKFVVYSSS